MKINDLALQIKVTDALGEILYNRSAKLEDKQKVDDIFFDIKQKFSVENNSKDIWREKTKKLREDDKEFSEKMKNAMK
jgi:ABC-type antimicrobial peptide transport system permease subunit